MDADDFGPDAPGELVTTSVDGYETLAFVPDPLPPAELDEGEFVDEVGQAMRALGQLDTIGPLAASNTMLVEAFARKEAVQSSRIEGTEVTLSDVYRYEARGDGTPSDEDEGARQAKNYLSALEQGLSAVEDGEDVTSSLLCGMQRTLLSGVRSEDPKPGELRSEQNYLAPFENAPISQATFVPPPPKQARETLESLLEFVNGRSPVHSLIAIGLVHYQFETIHPFRDGNGRLGRLLASLQLQRESLLPEPYLYLSAYFNEHRADYVRLLDGVRHRGEWTTWLHFVLRGIWIQAREAQIRGRRLLELRQAYTDRYQDHRSPYIVPLTHRLFENPYVTPGDVTDYLECSRQTAYNLIDELEDDGVLIEADAAGQERLFHATEVYDVLDEPIEDQ